MEFVRRTFTIQKLRSTSQIVIPIKCQVRLMSSENVIRVTKRGPVKSVMLNRPAQKNALNIAMWTGLADEINEGNKDNSTHVIVIEGHENFFSAGTDLQDFQDRLKIAQETGKTDSENLRNLVGALIDCKKPIVALVQGWAVGIGVTILPLCDFVYASDTATFMTPFTRLGIVPECCSSYTFPKLMGWARASKLLFHNQKIGAEEAKAVGLVTEVVGQSEFKEKTGKWVEELANLPLMSLQQSKELVRGPEREILHKVCRVEATAIENCVKGPEVAAAAQKLIDRKRT